MVAGHLGFPLCQSPLASFSFLIAAFKMFDRQNFLVYSRCQLTVIRVVVFPSLACVLSLTVFIVSFREIAQPGNEQWLPS